MIVYFKNLILLKNLILPKDLSLQGDLSFQKYTLSKFPLHVPDGPSPLSDRFLVSVFPEEVEEEEEGRRGRGSCGGGAGTLRARSESQKENNSLSLKTEPVTPGADATVYVWLMCLHIQYISGTETICMLLHLLQP